MNNKDNYSGKISKKVSTKQEIGCKLLDTDVWRVVDTRTAGARSNSQDTSLRFRADLNFDRFALGQAVHDLLLEKPIPAPTVKRFAVFKVIQRLTVVFTRVMSL
jgi:hypothetical protein